MTWVHKSSKYILTIKNLCLQPILSKFQVRVQVQRLSYDSVDKYIVPPQKSPLNGTLVKSISGQLGNGVVNPLREVPHIILYLTLVTDDSDDAKVSSKFDSDSKILFFFYVTYLSRKDTCKHG